MDLLVENPTNKASAPQSSALLSGISLSEYGSVGFRVRLRRLSEYGSVAYLVERPTRETQASSFATGEGYWGDGRTTQDRPLGTQKKRPQIIGNGPNTVSGSTVSNTEVRVSFS